MHKITLVCLLALAAPLLDACASAPRAPAMATDAQWAEVEKSFQGSETPPARERTVELRQWGVRYYLHLYDTSLKFYESFRDDPRRWMGVVQMHNKLSWIAKPASSPEEQQGVDALVTKQQRTKMEERVQELVLQGLQAADTPDEARSYFDYSLNVAPTAEAASAAAKRGETPEIGGLLAELKRLARRYPDDDMLPIYVTQFVNLRKRMGAGAAELVREWEQWSLSENSHVRALAAEQRRVLDMLARPLELAFVALDGRKVDLAALRGKVVLIDFWATWCGPCIEELPNIRRAHEAFNARGLEIVGISLDRNEDRPKLMKFLDENRLPWPQHFDGKEWESELAARFGIRSLPAMLLLGRDGIVASNKVLRGDELEKEIARLLGPEQKAAQSSGDR